MSEEGERHPAADLDETVHQRVRLGILAILSEADRASFTYLREALAVSDGNLSAHVTVLAKAGLVAVDKGFVDNRPRTWLRATKEGRATFHGEMAALGKLVDRYQNVAATTS
jgi:DNA-binding MarR family transcriptional regulator